ncbi:tetratricopeptide repeat protein [Sphingomonas immobilis]|uniref:Uncharacterized protein n=1 Tax=Sphingomonas immobilis TaxID=3063997 RepID=A0ABT9A437_9SPHN|nr:hypothetical protein [Sphingomonas sp. CA1-15]MDO7844308.1 hypothetical protein [Sphingomonas sp. CA1-15]
MAGTGELPQEKAGLMGWVALGLVALLAVVLLWWLGVARPLWSFVGAGLMLGATGYAIQGKPGLPGHPVTAFTRPIALDDGMVKLRDDMFGRFSGENQYIVASDAMIRSGDPKAAVQVLLIGIRRVPNSIALWTDLGLAFQTHDRGVVSPASKLAFEQAMRINPDHPAPPFFYGLALIQAEDFAGASRYWHRALALTPQKVGYRAIIAERVALLDRYLAETRER